MTFTWDTIYVINALICAGLMCLGFWGYTRHGDKVPLCMGTAYGIFCFSHILVLFGFRDPSQNFVVIVRFVAYVIVAGSMYTVITRRIKR